MTEERTPIDSTLTQKNDGSRGESASAHRSPKAQREELPSDRVQDLPWSELGAQELAVLGAESPELPTSHAKHRESDGTELPAWRDKAPAHPLFGLALSGGGIRSATFNLGVLTVLGRLGLLKHLDYLSTVSGGGYIGGFWSAWRKNRELVEKGGEDSVEKDGKNLDFPEWEKGKEKPQQLSHLRQFSNFLRPRLYLLSAETGRLVAGVAGAVIPSLVFSLSLLALGLFAFLGLASLLLAGNSPSLLEPAFFAALVSAVFLLVVHGVLEAVWQWRDEESKARASGPYVLWALLSVVIAGVLWFPLWIVVPASFSELLLPATENSARRLFQAAALPALPWLGAALALIPFRVLFSRFVFRKWQRRARQGAIDRAISRSFLAAAVWGTASAVWVGGQALAGIGVSGLIASASTATAGGGLFALARRLLGTQFQKPEGGRFAALVQPLVIQGLAYLTLAAASSALAAALVLAADSFGPNALLWVFAVLAVLFVAALFLFDPHENGFHSFYRARLVRAYLGASNPCKPPSNPPGATLECEKDDHPLSSLPKTKPIHLICCAANDLSSDPLQTLQRGAKSAVLSRLGFQVESHWTPWPKKKGTEEREARVTLGDAMTASAAAFNSHMGGRSLRLGQAATFLLGAIGLRLGLWLENPAAAATSLPARLWTWTQRKLPGFLYVRELLGQSRAGSSWIHLSDGAHFENLALYELIRRHCQFIIASDCGADPDRAFDDLGNVIRRVREDFQVEIDLDPTPLKLDDDSGLSARTMVVGEIQYPSGEIGVLLYLKPGLTGHEPADILHYSARNEDFPHEPTLDQFYDEEQWESYRRLGEYVAKTNLEPTLTQVRAKPKKKLTDREVRRFFFRSRYTSLVLAKDGASESSALGQAWARLHDRLAKPELEALRRQIEPLAVPDRPKAPTPDNGREQGDEPKQGAETEQMAKPKSASPLTREDQTAALPVLREALRLMEAVYRTTGMADDPRAPSHPNYLGWFNRFGRWAAAPLFRFWWPWLSSLHSEGFVRFLGDIFALPATGEGKGIVRKLEDHELEGNYVWERYRHGRRRFDKDWSPTRPRTRYVFDLQLLDTACLPGTAAEKPLSVALVEIEIQDTEGSWNFLDLYVAPGLWSLGIGEAFLLKLENELKEKTQLEKLVVHPKKPEQGLDALYTMHGFERESLSPASQGSKGDDDEDEREKDPPYRFVLFLEASKCPDEPPPPEEAAEPDPQ